MSLIAVCARRIAPRCVAAGSSLAGNPGIFRSIVLSSCVSANIAQPPPSMVHARRKEIPEATNHGSDSGFTVSFFIKVQLAAAVAFVLLIGMFYVRKWMAGKLDEYVRPVEFEDFVQNCLIREEVEYITYQQAFHVADVYLLSSKDDRKVIEEESYLPAWVIGHIPDARFRFRGSEKELKRHLRKALDLANRKNVIDLRVQNYPDIGDASIAVTVFVLLAARLLRSRLF